MISNPKLIVYKLGIFFTELTISVIYVISFLFLPLTKAFITKILKECDVQVNGNRPSDPKVIDNRFYCLIAKYSYAGLVDAYGNGYFECNDLTELFTKIFRSKYYETLCFHPSLLWRSFFTRHFFTQTEEDDLGKAYETGFESLDTNDEEIRTLSTGYWKHAKNLEESYKAKHELVAQKLKLKPGMSVIDLGCGEGAFCKYLAENYDVKVTGINISSGMVEKAKRFCKGLNATFKVMDVRRIKGTYDRITCIGMMEHFGTAEYKRFFETIRRCLADDGIFLLEVYSLAPKFAPISDGTFERVIKMFASDPYYLDLLGATENIFVIEDCQNLRRHGSITFKKWIDKMHSIPEDVFTYAAHKSFLGHKALDAQMSALHVTGKMQVFQLVFSKNGLEGGYDTVV